ncbi:hypothetical protein COBT_003467, partial [Conglomerata obtusa]
SSSINEGKFKKSSIDTRLNEYNNENLDVKNKEENNTKDEDKNRFYKREKRKEIKKDQKIKYERMKESMNKENFMQQ